VFTKVRNLIFIFHFADFGKWLLVDYWYVSINLYDIKLYVIFYQ
jgi:hypothetical protein